MRTSIWFLITALAFANGCCCKDGEWEYSYNADTGEETGGGAVVIIVVYPKYKFLLVSNVDLSKNTS